MRARSFIVIFILLIISAGCRPKYHTHFFRTDEGINRELTAEESYSVEGYRISERPLENLIVPGSGRVLVTNQSMTAPGGKELLTEFLTVKERITYRLAVDIPGHIQKDSLNIRGQSVCQIIGLYNLPDSLRLYRCRKGYLLIDSVKSSKFFATISAKYFNINNDSLSFSGGLWIKKR
jgi:hypothetical protein